MQSIFSNKYFTYLIYGGSLALLLLLMRYLELKFLIYNNSVDIYIGIIAIIFTSLGIWLALKLTKPKIQTIVIEKEVIAPAEISQDMIDKTGISKRELEILHMMAKGMSNQEICDDLYISMSTVKTHVSNILMKLDAKRRTQAVEIAKTKRLI